MLALRKNELVVFDEHREPPVAKIDLAPLVKRKRARKKKGPLQESSVVICT